jgi:hypothetical protein
MAFDVTSPFEVADGISGSSAIGLQPPIQVAPSTVNASSIFGKVAISDVRRAGGNASLRIALIPEKQQ